MYELDEALQPIHADAQLGVRGRYLDPAGAAACDRGRQGADTGLAVHMTEARANGPFTRSKSSRVIA